MLQHVPLRRRVRLRRGRGRRYREKDPRATPRARELVPLDERRLTQRLHRQQLLVRVRLERHEHDLRAGARVDGRRRRRARGGTRLSERALAQDLLELEVVDAELPAVDPALIALDAHLEVVLVLRLRVLLLLLRAVPEEELLRGGDARDTGDGAAGRPAPGQPHLHDDGRLLRRRRLQNTRRERPKDRRGLPREFTSTGAFT